MTNNGFRSAKVFVDKSQAGVLRETDEGYVFAYNAEYAESAGKSISLTLPKRAEPYFSRTLFPFFDGLIPEGWLLNVVSRNWKLDEKDRFGLLLVACKDCVGNVSIEEEKE